MSSPTSVDFLPRRLESIAVSSSPKKKRIKTIPPPEPEPAPVPTTNPIQCPLDLPVEVMANVLIFLIPDLLLPVCSNVCFLVELARVSKRCRALALDDEVWKRKKKEGLFWLPDDSRPIPSDMPTHMAISPFAKDKYPVFRIKYEAVKSRLNKDPKGNTGANKAVRWKDLDDGVVRTKRKISSPTRKSYKGGRDPAFKRNKNGYIYRLCYLEVDKILDEQEQE